jgi:hypothetical protein
VHVFGAERLAQRTRSSGGHSWWSNHASRPRYSAAAWSVSRAGGDAAKPTRNIGVSSRRSVATLRKNVMRSSWGYTQKLSTSRTSRASTTAESTEIGSAWARNAARRRGAGTSIGVSTRALRR